jgi:hypothetical protein
MSHSRTRSMLKTAGCVAGGAIVGAGVGAGTAILVGGLSSPYIVVGATYAAYGAVASLTARYAGSSTRFTRMVAAVNNGVAYGLVMGTATFVLASSIWQSQYARNNVDSALADANNCRTYSDRSACRPYDCSDPQVTYAINDQVQARCEQIADTAVKIILPVADTVLSAGCAAINFFKARSHENATVRPAAATLPSAITLTDVKVAADERKPEPYVSIVPALHGR